MCILNYIPEPTKPMFSAILFSFAWRSGWDQLLYVIAQLPQAIFSRLQDLIPCLWKQAMSDLCHHPQNHLEVVRLRGMWALMLNYRCSLPCRLRLQLEWYNKANIQNPVSNVTVNDYTESDLLW